MRAAKALLCIVAVLSVAACTTTPHTVSSHYFTTTVASSDQFEIASSRIALKKSKNQNVRSIARQMIANHTTSSHELKAIMASQGMPMPPAQMSLKHSAELDSLTKARPFSKAYLDAQESAHQEAIALFEQYRMNGDNADLRNFAAKTLPTLRHHLGMIEQAKR